MDNTDFNRLDGITKKYVDYRISGLTFSGGSGTSGTSGTSGGGTGSGSSGSSGTSGTSGINGSSGTSGANGSSGSSGTSGVSGSSGSSGSSGVNGSSGSSGTSGANGSSGSSGTSGANGSSGSSGTSGVSGSSGSSGSSGTSGSSGSSPNQNLEQTLSLGNTTGTYSILFADGSVSSPSISFTNDTNTGIYKAGTGTLDFSASGVRVGFFNQTGFNILATASNNSIQFRTSADGSVDYGIQNTTTGLNINRYDSLGNFVDTALIIGKPEGDEGVEFRDGSAATPSISFQNDINTGLFRSSSDVLGISVGGATQALISTQSITLQNRGTTSVGAIRFADAPGTGISNPSGTEFHILTNGSTKFAIGSSAGLVTVPFRLVDGSVSAPGLQFTSDTDTGFYRLGSGRIGHVSNGLLVLNQLSNENDLIQVRGAFTASNNVFYNYALATSAGDGRWKLGLDALDTTIFRLDRWSGGAFAARALEIGASTTKIFASGATAAVFGSTNSTISSLTTGRVRTDAGVLSNYTETGTIGITIDGGGSAITTGLKNWITIPFNCEITSWTILSDVSGSIVIDVWKDTYGNYPPTVADSIAGTQKPTLSSQNKNQDTNLTTWTADLSEGDILAFNVDSASTITKINLTLKINK